MADITIVHGVYKPTYNWGAHNRGVWRNPFNNRYSTINDDRWNTKPWFLPFNIGGLSGWWFGTWLLWLSIQLGISSSQPNWRTPSFFRGVGQPPTRHGFSLDTGKHRPIDAPEETIQAQVAAKQSLRLGGNHAVTRERAMIKWMNVSIYILYIYTYIYIIYIFFFLIWYIIRISLISPNSVCNFLGPMQLRSRNQPELASWGPPHTVVPGDGVPPGAPGETCFPQITDLCV